MRLAIAVSFVLIITLCASAQAGDLAPVGQLSSPGLTTRLEGLDHADGKLFAVSDLYGKMSCFYLINRWNAAYSETCFTETIGACSDDSLNFKANAYISGDEPGAGDYVFADQCGALARYRWFPGTHVLDSLQSFIPSTLIEDHATGLTYAYGFYFALEPDVGEIHQIDRYTLGTQNIISLPEHIENASGIAEHDENFLIVSTAVDSLWVVDWYGGQVASYYLLDMGGTPRGITVIGDSVYVCSQDTTIKIYTFGTSYSEPVPEGDAVEVEVVPDQAKVTFDAVTDSGSLDAEVLSMQPCPPPGGVEFFSDYYDMSTDATFEYIAAVDLMTETELPGGVDPKKVRVFKRPSGLPCGPWRDVTVAPLEFVEEPRDPALRALTRTQSEDDEFSMFVLGEDNRNPRAVITLKFAYLDSAVIGNQDSIPNETYNQIMVRITAAKYAAVTFKFLRAARLVDRVASIVRDTPAIPHTYKPGGPQENIAGQIISRAHTLSFSLRSLIKEDQVGPPPSQGKTDADIPADEFAPRLGLSENPSVSGCTIMLSGVSSRPLDLSIYSVTGELVKTLLEHETLTGKRSITWDG